jgi:hypothetical protein
MRERRTMTGIDRHGEPARCCSVAEAEARDGVRVLSRECVLALGERKGITPTGGTKRRAMSACLVGLSAPCSGCGAMLSHDRIAGLSPDAAEWFLCPRCEGIVCDACWLADHNGGSCGLVCHAPEAPVPA